MNTVLIGLGLGLAAAVLDVAPMLAQRLPAAACLSAAVQWLFLGLVICNTELGLPGWLTGLILGVAGSLPVILVAVGNPGMVKPGEELRTTLTILASSLVLGTVLGLVSRLARG
jgi:hypothetical protein